MKRIEKVTLVGLGAIGSFFAPRMEQYLGRENFHVLAEGERKKRLEEKGVTINDQVYRFNIVTPEDEIGPADLILISVKYGALQQVAEQIRNQVGPDTIILTLLNGVDSEEVIASVYGWEHMLYSYMRGNIVMKNGCATYKDEQMVLRFGEKENKEYSEKVLAVQEVMERCHIPNGVDEDMLQGMWFKYMANVGQNTVSALLGVNFMAYRVSEHANFLRYGAMREVIAIANAKGIALTEAHMEKQNGILQTLVNPANKPSTLQDIEAGRHTEVDMLSGTVIRMGEE